MKVVTVIGAPPQFIKASVVSAELGMAKPAYNLDIKGSTHSAMTGRMLEGVEQILLKEKPDLMLVYGDTNSTLAGALAAAKLHIPVAHVEAGLRSFNMKMPEEINRILTDRISSWLFAPTDEAVKHLQGEGVESASIYKVGDVMYDVALYHGSRAMERDSGVLQKLDLEDKGFVLATVHRAENTDMPERLATIIEAFIAISSELLVVWPLHPRTHHILEKNGDLLRLQKAGVRLIEPLGYLDMVQMEKAATVIATDSGGVQKEAFFHQVPCITLRDETEWVELVEAGWNQLIQPVSASAISDAVLQARGRRGEKIFPYGEGDSARRIVQHLVSGGSR